MTGASADPIPGRECSAGRTRPVLYQRHLPPEVPEWEHPGMTHFPDAMHSPPAGMVLDCGPSAAASLPHCSELHSENESEHLSDRSCRVPRSKRLSQRAITRVEEHVFEPLLSAEQAAVLLGGIHPKTLMRWARRREIPAFQIGRGWFFRASQLNHWLLTSGKIRPANAPA
jgi:excisionase family DNA binding protein